MYGMQASGASLAALLASQWEQTIAVIDLWNNEVAPDLCVHGPLVVKATTGPVPLADHVAAFRPTATVLVLRDPRDQISSLTHEPHRDYAAPIEAKLAEIERAFAARSSFDSIVHYEELVQDTHDAVSALRSAGLPLRGDAARFPRSLARVVDYTRRSSTWCRDNWRTRWGTGRVNAATAPLCAHASEHAPEALALALAHCPSLLEYYDRR